MRFDESAYPNPAEMMSALHRQNFHMVISVWAKFGAETQVDKEFVARILCSRARRAPASQAKPKSSENWADLFNPQAQKMFWSDIDRNLFSAGLDGWWLDASEPEGDPLKRTIKPSSDPERPYGTHSRFLKPLRCIAGSGRQARRQARRNSVALCYAGQQRNGSISWSGDISANWETFRRQIPAGLSFGMSGFPYWTTDIGGFFRPGSVHID